MEQLLSDTAHLLPFMTPEDHGIASRLASILLLRFLQPTYCQKDETYKSNFVDSNNNNDSNPSSSEKSDLPIDINYNQMLKKLNACSLSERLENCNRFYSVQRYSYGARNDLHLAKLFRRFLYAGLSSFLSSRPAHPNHTDLIDLLALSISPSISPFQNYISTLVNQINENSSNSSSISPSSIVDIPSTSYSFFQANDADRFLMVDILCNNLVVPDMNLSNFQEAPLFVNTIPHLRASVQAFSNRCLTLKHIYSAQKVMTNISIYSQNHSYLLEDTYTLVSYLVDDGYRCDCSGNNESPTCSKKLKGCFSSKISVLLQELIMQQSSHNTEPWYEENLRQTTLLLANVMRKEFEKSKANKKDRIQLLPPCKLAGIIDTCTLLFQLQLYDMESTDFTDNDNDENDLGEPDAKKIKGSEAKVDDPLTVLIEASIELLSHDSLIVVQSSGSLLESAPLFFGKTNKKLSLSYLKRIFAKCKTTFLYHISKESEVNSVANKEEQSYTSIANALQPVFVTLSRQSRKFLSSFLTYILSQLNQKEIERSEKFDLFMTSAICECASKLANLSPYCVTKYLHRFLSILSTKSHEKDVSQILATFLSCRRNASNFDGTSSNFHSELLVRVKDSWLLYKLARHALSTSNFDIAGEIYERKLLTCATAEKSYLWLTVLQQMSTAEDIVAKQGTIGLPEGISMLNSSLTHLRSLVSIQTNDVSREISFLFQIGLLSNRIDFFNLCVTVNSLAHEMLLTGSDMSRHTRSGLHVRNLYFCFHALAKRYIRLHRTYGILYCRQTRASLRSLAAMCCFMGKMTSKVFSMPILLLSEQSQYPNGDSTSTCVQLMERLYDKVMDLLNENVDNFSRSKVLMEVMNVVLKGPAPFPRGFLAPKMLPIASIRLSADPLDISITSHSNSERTNTDNATEENNISESEDTYAEVIEVQPGFSCTIYASGKVPNIYLHDRYSAISQLLSSYTITYDGPLSDANSEDNRSISNASLDEEDDSSFILSNNMNEGNFVASPFFPNGKYLIPIECTPMDREGYYIVNVTLSCRDIDGGEWEISTPPDSSKIFVCVSCSARESESNPLVNEQC